MLINLKVIILSFINSNNQIYHFHIIFLSFFNILHKVIINLKHSQFNTFRSHFTY